MMSKPQRLNSGLIALTALAWLASPGVARAQTCGSLSNSGFESNLAGWQDNGNTTVHTDARSGAKAVRIGSNTGGLSREDIPVSPGNTIAFEVWAKLSSSPGWTGLGVGFRNATGTDLDHGGDMRQVTQTSYTRYSFALTVPADAALAYIWTWKNGNSGYLHLDDFCFTEIDTVAPSKPANLSARDVSQTGFVLTWSAANDNTGVARYEVRRDGNLVASTTTTSLPVSGLSPGTTYAMTVTAVDAAGNANTSATLSTATIAATTSCGSVDNNGFESGLDGWSNNGNVTATHDDARSGGRAARTGTGVGGISYDGIAVRPGDTIAFEVWAKLSDSPGWTGLGVGFRNGAGNDMDGGVQRQITQTTYSRHAFEVTAPAGAAEAYIWTWKNGSGYLHLDDFCLTIRSDGGGGDGDDDGGGALWPNIRVVGNRLYDRYGKPFALRGIESMYGTTGRANPEAWVASHAALGANAIGPLPNSSANSAQDVERLVRAAYEQGLVIGLNSDHTGQGASFFTRSDIRAIINRYPNVFLQEAVELGSMSSISSNQWVQMAKGKIDALVDLFPDKPIKIGSPSGGRAPRYALDRCSEVVDYYYAKGGRGGVIFTAQMYWKAGGSGTSWYQMENGFSPGLGGILEAIDAMAASPCMFMPGLDAADDVGYTGWREIMTHVRAIDPNPNTRLSYQWWVLYNSGDPYGNDLTTNQLNALAGITSVGREVKQQLEVDRRSVELGPLD